MQATANQILTDEQIAEYEHDGYLLMRGLFSPEETAVLREHFMKMQRQALVGNSPMRKHYQPATREDAQGDILKHFPRIMMPHRFDE